MMHRSEGPPPTGSSARLPDKTSYTVPEPECAVSESHEMLPSDISTPVISSGVANTVASDGAQSQASP